MALTFPIANSPLSKNITSPKKRKAKPNVTRPRPISAGEETYNNYETIQIDQRCYHHGNNDCDKVEM